MMVEIVGLAIAVGNGRLKEFGIEEGKLGPVKAVVAQQVAVPGSCG
jgi:hypothetical protein